MGQPRRPGLRFAGIGMLVIASLAAGCGSPAAGGGASAQRGTTRPADPPVITVAAARRVLSGYAAAVSRADKLRQTRLLAAAESGSSYQMDAGSYRFTRVSDPGNEGYQALSVKDSALYIPRGPGPSAGEWWAATARWIRPLMPGSPPVPVLLVFTRAAGGWRQVLEPGTLGPVPPPVTGLGGYASAVSSGARSLAVAPREIPAATASYLNGLAAAGPLCPRPGLCRHVPARTITLARPSSLPDVHDQAFWAGRLPSGSADSDLHSVTQDPVYAISTQGGGALVLYDLRAVLELAPPAGYTFRITIPGFYSAAVPRTQATLTYADQFASYDPPVGGGLARVVAEAGGPVSAG